MVLIKMAAIVFAVEFLFIVLFFSGENFATKFPGYKFSRWWRKNIAMSEEDL